ncbi:UNVERIFIED_CONTAM: hypothetical protein PYX00_001382 [Menopon gallinae]|uniref:Titin n=1 Tax=Menopon gallinae TaxID=328185 RepID=A0AAW2ID02_9NEOP
MGNQQGKERRPYPRRIDWDNAEKPSPPGKPYLVPDADEQSDFITIRWAPPVTDGGAPILGYVVEHRRTGSPHWLRAIPYLATETKLTLTGLEPGWRYQFRVSAENDIGRSPPGEISEVLTVTSQRTAATSPHFNVELQDTIALENEKVEFTVHVVAIPQAKIAWYKDGFEVFSSRRMKIVTENDQSTFIIHQAALEDEGEIKCTATNRAGHSVTKAILKLEAPPRIRLPRQYEDGLLFEKGELIRLKVSTAGRPPPSITWYHNGELLQNNEKYEIKDAERTSSLRISEATREDRGEYQIRGINKIGEDLVCFLVTVTDRPSPPGKATVSMALGRSVTLSWTSPEDDGGCKIGSYTVEYYRVGWNMWLKAATCRQLSTVLSDLIEGSEYKFRIKAENPYGMSDPGEESDIIFIPDPKRGIFSPPQRKDTAEMDLWRNGVGLESTDTKDSELKSEKRRLLEENARKLLDTPLSQLLQSENRIEKPPRKLASPSKHLEKVTESVKRSFEDVENIPPPVPKRRHKADKQRSTPSPSQPMELDIPKSEESSRFSSPVREKPVEKKEEEEQSRFPREKDHTMFHGSSELMLVLLPHERSKSGELSAQQKSEIEMSLIGAGVAPPMSLSAPELGSNEPFEMPMMREAVSSSELLHERAMTRLYQDAMDEESQRMLKRRYSGDRKSVERRSSFREGTLERRPSFREADRKDLNRFSVSRDDADITTASTDLRIQKERSPEVRKSMIPVRKKSPEEARAGRLSSVEREQMEFALVRERIRMKNEQNLQHKGEVRAAPSFQHQHSVSSTSSQMSSYEEDDERMEDEEIEEDEDYLEEEEEELEESEEEVESLRDTQYRPKSVLHQSPPPIPKHSIPEKTKAPIADEEDDSILPVTSRIVLPRLEITLPPTIEVSEVEEKKKSPEPEVQHTEITEEIREMPSKIPVKTGKKRAVKILKKLGLKRDKKIPEIIIETDSSADNPTHLPKPILKNKPSSKKKDKENKKASASKETKISFEDVSDDGLRKKKQVRIAEPNETVPTKEQKQAEEDEQANKVLIYHYSDIVREFGHGKKPPTKQYLNCEEMKAFVTEEPKRKTPSPSPPPPQPQQTGSNLSVDVAQEKRESPAKLSDTDAVSSATEAAPPPEQNPLATETPANVRTTIDYLTDVAMFLIACYLYLFANELYAVPVLALMAYRQASESVREKYSNLKTSFRKRFSKKRPEEG